MSSPFPSCEGSDASVAHTRAGFDHSPQSYHQVESYSGRGQLLYADIDAQAPPYLTHST
jgi:hypothetical protein